MPVFEKRYVIKNRKNTSHISGQYTQWPRQQGIKYQENYMDLCENK